LQLELQEDKMAEEFLQCPYSKQCSIHYRHDLDTQIIKSSGSYKCSLKGENSLYRITNCTYLHQLANEDKQTELLEKIISAINRK